MPTELTTLLSELDSGDADAPARLLNLYGTEIRRFIRFRMRDSVLRRLHDSIDVEQSVFRRFFQRASSGDLRLANEDELRAYLFTLAKNRLRELKRQQTTAKRKAKFVEEDSRFNMSMLPSTDAAPDAAAAETELLLEVQSLVTAEDWKIVVQRLEGRTWQEVAEDRGVLPDAIRKRLQAVLGYLKSRITDSK